MIVKTPSRSEYISSLFPATEMAKPEKDFPVLLSAIKNMMQHNC